MSHLTQVRTQIERLKSVRASNKELLTTLADKLDELKDDPAEIAALAEELRAEVDGIGNDILAHTPSENEPEVPEDPTTPEETNPEARGRRGGRQ